MDSGYWEKWRIGGFSIYVNCESLDWCQSGRCCGRFRYRNTDDFRLETYRQIGSYMDTDVFYYSY